MWGIRLSVVPASLVLLGGLLSSTLGQDTSPPKHPAPDAQIVRIEYGSESGMCYGYCYNQTIIDARTIRHVSRTNYSLNGNRDSENPDKKSRRKITVAEWERAKAAVDTESLFALPDRMGCPGCVDEPVDWIQVDYSDGTKKSVMCNSGDLATDIVDKVKAAIAVASGKSPKKSTPQ